MPRVFLRPGICGLTSAVSIITSGLVWGLWWLAIVAIPGVILAYAVFLGLQGWFVERWPQHVAQPWRITSWLALIFTILGTGVFAVLHSDLTYEWPPQAGERDVRGTSLTQDAAHHQEKSPQELVMGFGGDKTQAWTTNSIHRAEASLALSYLGVITPLLLLVFSTAEAFRRSAADSLTHLRKRLIELTGHHFRVFVSYRRTNAGYIVGRLRTFLESALGENGVFLDIDSIGAGANFPRVIEDAIVHADAMLVIIGRDWTQGMDREVDFVREEVEVALRKRVPLLPVFVDGQRMLDPSTLPAAIRGLTNLNGLALRPDPDFDDDAMRILEALVNLGKRERQRPLRKGTID